MMTKYLKSISNKQTKLKTKTKNNTMKTQNVTVVASKLGHVITPSENNPDFGFVQLEQNVVSYEGKFRSEKRKVATIWGEVEKLKGDGFYPGQQLPGKIIIVESLAQTNPKNVEQDMKKAGNTGVVCTLGDQPIYRTSLYTTDLSKEDTLIAHDNVDQIKEAQAALLLKEGASEENMIVTPTA